MAMAAAHTIPGARPGPPSATSTTVKPITADTERSMHRTNITRTWPITTTPSTAAWRLVLRMAASLKKRGDVTAAMIKRTASSTNPPLLARSSRARSSSRGAGDADGKRSTEELSVTLVNLYGKRLPRTLVVCTSCCPACKAAGGAVLARTVSSSGSSIGVHGAPPPSSWSAQRIPRTPRS